MPSTTSFDLGDVVLVPFPFTDQTTSKRRPAVVVSSLAFHQETADVIVMAVTSQSREQASLETAIAQWQEAGLVRPSVVKPVLATLERSLIVKRLGRLETSDREALRTKLQAVLGR